MKRAWLAAGIALGCNVERTPTVEADPAEVPTASALSCSDGQFVTWSGGAWTCASPPAPDYAAFGSCGAGQKVTGIDAKTGNVQCATDLDTDTDTDTDSLADVGACDDGEVLKWQDGAWACGVDVDTTYTNGDGLALADMEFSVDATVSRTDHTHAAPTVMIDAAGISLQEFADQFVALRDRVETLEAALCPPGFGYVTSDAMCLRTVFVVADAMVKVGDFWIDRYEMSSCTDAGGGMPGTWGEPTGYGTTAVGCSTAGATPQESITWFQAAQMCANAGKRLCTNAEWQTAASGTPDPGADGGATGCNVNSNGGMPAPTGEHSDCVSRFGAYDMAGNLWEWVADWHGMDSATNSVVTNATYGDDYMYDVSPATNQGGGANFPAAALRGGGWPNQADAGAFALGLFSAPSHSDAAIGARCCAGGR